MDDKTYIISLILACFLAVSVSINYQFYEQITLRDNWINEINDLNDNIDEMDRHHHSYEKCLNDIDTNKKEDIVLKYVRDVDFCYIDEPKDWIEPCNVQFDFWSDNSTSISIHKIGGNSK